MPSVITLIKGKDYHEVEGKGARDPSTAQEAQGPAGERVTRLEGGPNLFEISFADIEARILAHMQDTIKRSRRPK